MTRFTAAASTIPLFLVALLALPSRADASPLDAGRIPADADGVGHIDMDALRKTALHRQLAPRLMKEVDWKDADPATRPLFRALIDTVQGVSFWMTDKDAGAVLIQVPDARRIQGMLDKLPRSAPVKVGGITAYRYRLSGKKGPVIGPTSKGDDTLIASVGNTFILSEDTASLGRAIEAASRRGRTLGSTRAVLDGAQERGVFFFTALNARMLDKVKDAAQSQTLRVNMSSLTVNVGETNAQLRVRVKLVLSSADEASKIKSMIEGVLALVSMSDEAAEVRPFAKSLKITASGKTLEMTMAMASAELVKIIESNK